MGTGGAEAPALPLEALVALGLDQRTAENALVNNKVTANLAAVIAEVSLSALSSHVQSLMWRSFVV
jgi:glutaminyl-tRNA synthetase